ncbi:MAG: hypothetical protein DRQ64_00300 [Gammaproteobacteria bacterium]|nr:MAG: hypothetical protein DRQ64_00300 [Gammaproteobacteria bacterium]
MMLSYTYKAKVLRVVDGDTIDLEIDLGFRQFGKHRCRLHGIDTPETYGVKKDSVEYKAGWAAKDAVLKWLDQWALIEGEVGRCWEVLIRSHDGGYPRAGKYGRWIVEVYPYIQSDPKKKLSRKEVLNDNRSLNDYLVEAGHAVRKEY